MRIKLLLLTAAFALALTVNSVHANLLIAYRPDGAAANDAHLGLFSDTGTLLRTYATGFGNVQHVMVDSSGNGYLANADVGANGLAAGFYKYNLTTGVGRLLFSQAGYTPIGLGASPFAGEILIAGADSSAPTQALARINSTTGVINASFNSAGTYYDAEYDPASGRIIAVYDATTPQSFSNSLTDPQFLPALAANTRSVTALGGQLYYALQNGQIRRGDNSLIYSFAGGEAYDITNDGTNLIAANFNTGMIARIALTGGPGGLLPGGLLLDNGLLIDSFDVGTIASGVAFTTIPEPSTVALVALSSAGLMLFRRRPAA